MYELWHVGTAYVVGTALGFVLFRQYIKESIITMTIDSLVEQEYVRSYEDQDGTIHLHKWHDLEDILEQIQEAAKDYEEDDTP
jgi:DNA-binding MarR family transcriptional regulator